MTASERVRKTPSESTFQLAIELIRYKPARFALNFGFWTVIHVAPLLFGILLGRLFDALANGAEAGTSAWTLLVIYGALAIGRNGLVWAADVQWIGYWNEQALQLRRNLLRWLLEADGSRVVPSSAGEAISTFRDDVEDLMEYIENYVDGGGIALYGVGSVAVMATIDWRLTLLLLIPLVLVLMISQALGPQIRTRRRAMRKSTEEVTGFIGETFGAVQSVKLAAAEDAMLAEFRRRNKVRRRNALRDTFLTEALLSINHNMATVTVAIVLLVASDGIGDGTFSVGDLAVFLTLLPRLTFNLAFVGHIIAQHRRTGVSYERIRRLAVDATDEDLLDPTPVPLAGELGELPPRDRGDDDRLRRLIVRGMTFHYPDSPHYDPARSRSGVAGSGVEVGAGSGVEPVIELDDETIVLLPDEDHIEPVIDGIEDVGFVLERGSFTVLAGRIGSGKTTILRALLGLLPADGVMTWNGVPVRDPASFLVPPRSAYTPQIPRLFSDTLAYNIALRESSTRDHVYSAARIAVMDVDLDRLANGVDTMVGARGVKLSGGQIQRSAVARMFATEADLLVFDDLSSALDLHTEAELWQRLFDHRDATCLVASHRPAALERADQILVVDGGRIVDRGRLSELLERSEVMNELWEAGR